MSIACRSPYRWLRQLHRLTNTAGWEAARSVAGARKPAGRLAPTSFHHEQLARLVPARKSAPGDHTKEASQGQTCEASDTVAATGAARNGADVRWDDCGTATRPARKSPIGSDPTPRAPSRRLFREVLIMENQTGLFLLAALVGRLGQSGARRRLGVFFSS